MSTEPQPETPTEKTESRKKRFGCLKLCLVVFIILAFPLVWFNISTPLRVSKETTYVLGPMTSDGKRIDYFLAMEEQFYPPEMKTDDNGYRLIVRACGDMVNRDKSQLDPKTRQRITEKIDAEPFRLQVYEKLGLDPDEKPTLKIQSPYAADYFGKRDNKEELEQRDKFMMWKTFWTFDDFPMLKVWLEENTAGIDLLAEAVRKPAFRIPYVRENENTPIFEACMPLNEVQMLREWARAASARAYYRLGIGDIDGAIDDIVTIHRLARHGGRHGTLVAGLVGIAIEGVASAIGIGINPNFPPTKEQLERLVAELNALPPRPTMGEVLESERYFNLAAIQDMYWGNNSSSSGEQGLMQLYPYMSWTIDINLFMTRWNKEFDEVRDGNFDFNVRNPSWNPLPLLFIRSRTNSIYEVLFWLAIPAIQGGQEEWHRMECAENMQRLTLALLLYEKKHGKLPADDWRQTLKEAGTSVPDNVFRCPSHGLQEGYTTYAMIGGVPNSTLSPYQILLVEVVQPQKLGEGDGRFPFEKAKFWGQNNVPRHEGFDGLGSYHRGGMNAGFRSGAVRFVGETIEQEKLQQLLDGSAAALP